MKSHPGGAELGKRFKALIAFRTCSWPRLRFLTWIIGEKKPARWQGAWKKIQSYSWPRLFALIEVLHLLGLRSPTSGTQLGRRFVPLNAFWKLTSVRWSDWWPRLITLYPCIGTIDPNLKKKTALFHTNFHYCVDHLITIKKTWM